MIKSKPLSGEHEDLGEPTRSKRPSTPALGLIELGALQGAAWSRRAGAGQGGGIMGLPSAYTFETPFCLFVFLFESLHNKHLPWG